jgi:UDP-N-acetylmuramate--alanine ligase
MEDFASAFNLADVVLLLDIYPAGETPIEGVSTPALVEKIRSFGHKNVVYSPSYEAIEKYLAENAKDGDAVIVMGAGSVTKLSDQLAVKLSRNGAA